MRWTSTAAATTELPTARQQEGYSTATDSLLRFREVIPVVSGGRCTATQLRSKPYLADHADRRRADRPFGHSWDEGTASQPPMDLSHDPSAAASSCSVDAFRRQISVLQTHLTQAEHGLVTIERSHSHNAAVEIPSALVNSLSVVSSALAAFNDDLAAMHPSPIPPSHPSPPAAHPAATHTEHTTAHTDNGTANPLSEDLYRDVVTRFLPVDVAVSSARAANKTSGIDLVDETFMLTRIDTDLSRRSLRGLIDVERPFQYYTKCAHALEYGGALWCEWPDFIRLADIYKLTPSTGLPLIMSPQWMAAHLPTKADFHTMPLALRQYSTFGHLLNYKGTSLALTKVDEADDGGEGKEGDGEGGSQGEGEGDGGVTRQRYRIGVGEEEWRFETVPLSGLPPRHPYRRTYDPHNPPIRRHGFLFPSFTAFMKRMVLTQWFNQEGVGEKLVFRVGVGRGDERYQRVLTDPIDGHATIDFIEEGERQRFIMLKGMKEDDTVAAYLWVCRGYIILFATEAEIEGHTPWEDQLSISAPLLRSLLTKYRLAHIIPRWG
ncbi:unnamed protein product [Vitrella brassicaformis CCMP3155]|uniref:Uncharacterized protein n=1 Tax=Vitrella brassicaformis (strain CCMP3155) TaxID=1169540 RepID=A0A0G4GA15_VITBC|nr:unnamed protein product [Vitrella brassicaformis CCMP3155]|eukprot:CEM25382.1 unnamed protein product [Vitrella brassicaformis CCMP3155]